MQHCVSIYGPNFICSERQCPEPGFTSFAVGLKSFGLCEIRMVLRKLAHQL